MEQLRLMDDVDDYHVNEFLKPILNESNLIFQTLYEYY